VYAYGHLAAAQNARAEAVAEAEAALAAGQAATAAALEASRTDEVFAKFAMKLAQADEKEAEGEEQAYHGMKQEQQHHGMTDVGAGMDDIDMHASSVSELNEQVHTPPRLKPQSAHTHMHMHTHTPSASVTGSVSLVTAHEEGTSLSPQQQEQQEQQQQQHKLPNRQPLFRIFADEEPKGTGSDDSREEEEEEGSKGAGRWLDEDGDLGFPGEAHPPRMQRMKRENGKSVRREDITDQMLAPTIAEQREMNVIKQAKANAAKHRLQFVAVDHGEQGGLEHAEMVDRMLNPTLIAMPDPPRVVGALGKDGCAAVWWHYDREQIQIESWVSSWEVRRYRLDKDKQWRYKGSTIINEPHLIGKNRITVLDLENDCQYKFSVIGTNTRGAGFESVQSEPVMVCADVLGVVSACVKEWIYARPAQAIFDTCLCMG